ncbi:MAG: glycosyltransferase [Saprospiraceae bacterium]
MSNSELRSNLSKSDLVILPSRFDGWGAIVNESLMVGTPVVCSNMAGASDLINELNGDVFNSENITHLAQILSKRINQGFVPLEIREQIIKWSDCISPQVVAKYFYTTLFALLNKDEAHNPPPWLN